MHAFIKKHIYFQHWKFDEKILFLCFFFHSWNEWQVTIILVKNFNVVVEHNLFTCKKKWVFGGIFYAVYRKKIKATIKVKIHICYDFYYKFQLLCANDFFITKILHTCKNCFNHKNRLDNMVLTCYHKIQSFNI